MGTEIEEMLNMSVYNKETGEQIMNLSEMPELTTEFYSETSNANTGKSFVYNMSCKLEVDGTDIMDDYTFSHIAISPMHKHKKYRVQKKWNKRYGMKICGVDKDIASFEGIVDYKTAQTLYNAQYVD